MTKKPNAAKAPITEAALIGQSSERSATRAKERSAEAAPNLRLALAQGVTVLRRGLLTLMAFSLVLNVLALATPIYLFQISDRVLTSRSFDTLAMLTILIVGALGLHAALDVLRRLYVMRIAMRLETTLATPVLTAATRAANLGAPQELQAVGDLAQLRNFLTSPVLLTLMDAPITPLFFVTVFMIHPDLGWIITGFAGLTVLLALWNQRATRLHFAEAHSAGGRAALYLDSIGRNAQVVGAMGMTPEASRLWGRETASALSRLVRGQDGNIVITGLSKFLRMAVQIALLGWGALLALEGQITGGMMIAASMIAGRALAPLDGAIEGWRSYLQATTAYGRIARLLRSSPLNLARLRLPKPEGRLTVNRILYAPPPNKTVLLNGISFALEPGEALAVVGPSGAGKSTLARLLIGAIAPAAGETRLSGTELRHWDPAQFGEIVGYLPQEVQLFPVSVKANIARLRMDATDADIYAAADFAGVHDVITKLPQGYETMLGQDGAPLSGGQKQRIALARAFFGSPSFVVLDEPNSNLDSEGDAALSQAIKKARQKGITTVTITQRQVLLRHVDKVLVLEDGKMKMFGDRDDVVRTVYGESMAKAILGSAARAPSAAKGVPEGVKDA
ncbi:type I secretion system permease/ATPase [Celeribacter marinus]|uniref:type I secretion system permease/ATPase n=1 Tax=Celeribacter marinus TaxID=1397108 RepID=UPI00317AE454